MIETAQHSIGTTPVLISAAHHMDVRLHIHTEEVGLANAIYIGNFDVDSDTGMRVSRSQDVDITLPPGQELYAVASGAGRELHVMRIAED